MFQFFLRPDSVFDTVKETIVGGFYLLYVRVKEVYINIKRLLFSVFQS